MKKRPPVLTLTVDELFSDLYDRTNDALTGHLMAATIMNTANEKRGTDAFTEFERFFGCLFNISLSQSTILLNELLKGSSDTQSIPHCVKEAYKEGLVPESLITEIEADIASLKPIIGKIGYLRGNVFGHRSATITFKAGIAHSEMKLGDTDDALTSIYGMLSKIAHHLKKKIRSKHELHELIGTSAAKMLLRALDPHAAAREKIEPFKGF